MGSGMRAFSHKCTTRQQDVKGLLFTINNFHVTMSLLSWSRCMECQENTQTQVGTLPPVSAPLLCQPLRHQLLLTSSVAMPESVLSSTISIAATIKSIFHHS